MSIKGIRSGVTVTAALGLGLLAAAPAGAAVVTPKFQAGSFSTNTVPTNPYDPLIPGSVLYYEGKREGHASTERFEVTKKVKYILGVPCVVIHDQGFIEGHLHENTYDWYAQDKKGNVWYFGEKTAELAPGGEVESTEGSWEAGQPAYRGGPVSKPGIFMPAKPEVGVGFKQEIAPTVSEDEFEVAKLATSVSTPFIATNRALETNEFSSLEPGVLDHKFFAFGVGEVVELTAVGPEDELRLVNYERR